MYTYMYIWTLSKSPSLEVTLISQPCDAPEKNTGEGEGESAQGCYGLSSRLLTHKILWRESASERVSGRERERDRGRE